MKKWYDKGTLVAFACFIFPPLGIYALWKSSTIEKNGKIIFGLIALIWMSVPFMGSNQAKTTKQESAIVDTAKAIVQSSGSLYASKEDSIKAYNEAYAAIQKSEKEETKNENEVKEESPSQSTPTQKNLEVGGEAYVSSNNMIFTAVNEDMFSEMNDLIQAKDELGIRNMIEQGYCVPLATGTRLKIIDVGFLKVRARVTTGKFRGASIYVDRELINGL